jgi:hypothetical protein
LSIGGPVNWRNIPGRNSQTRYCLLELIWNFIFLTLLTLGLYYLHWFTVVHVTVFLREVVCSFLNVCVHHFDLGRGIASTLARCRNDRFLQRREIIHGRLKSKVTKGLIS